MRWGLASRGPLPGRLRSGSTTRRRPRERERPGYPVFQNIGAYSAEPKSPWRSVAGGWTDSNLASRVYVLSRWMSVIASVPKPDAGDGLRPPQNNTPPNGRRGCGFPDRCRSITQLVLAARPPSVSAQREASVSYRTIAAALALDSVTASERLVAFSLASFADGKHQAFPGDAAAAARAGLSRSR